MRRSTTSIARSGSIPRSPSPIGAAGRAWDRKRDDDKALAEFDLALSFDPELRLRLTMGGAIIRLRRKEWDKAIKDCNRAIELDPTLA